MKISKINLLPSASAIVSRNNFLDEDFDNLDDGMTEEKGTCFTQKLEITPAYLTNTKNELVEVFQTATFVQKIYGERC